MDAVNQVYREKEGAEGFLQLCGEAAKNPEAPARAACIWTWPIMNTLCSHLGPSESKRPNLPFSVGLQLAMPPWRKDRKRIMLATMLMRQKQRYSRWPEWRARLLGVSLALAVHAAIAPLAVARLRPG